jgi:hypothetical protein
VTESSKHQASRETSNFTSNPSRTTCAQDKMKTISEYDRRQYELMLDQIQAYNAGKIQLGHLVSGLKSLSNVLENTSSDWDSDFFDNWLKLEMGNARLINEKLFELGAQEKVLIYKAVGRIKSLIDNIISNSQL